ncbi:proline-rich protein 5-like isoform 1-T1 [Synchiropus picturatus]
MKYRLMMGSFRRARPRIMSSPALADLARFHASSPAAQISNSSVWSSVHSAVAKIFQGGALQVNELYTLNESIRFLLRTEMGSFICEYFQNQVLSQGLYLLLDQVLSQSEEKQPTVLAEVWDQFFTETLPTLQAIFYPVQGLQLSIRHICLLSFRDLIVLKLPLEDFLTTTASVPSSVTQMLLVLQGVHDSTGPGPQYRQLERLVEMIVSPYLSNTDDRSQQTSDSHQLRRDQPEISVTPPRGIGPTKYLAPLVEHESGAYLNKCAGARRHTVANAGSDVYRLSMKLQAGTSKVSSRGFSN